MFRPREPGLEYVTYYFRLSTSCYHRAIFGIYAGKTTTNTVEEQPVQNGEADFLHVSSTVSSHYSSLVSRKTKANGGKVSSRFKETKQRNLKEAKAILEVLVSGEVDRPTPASSDHDVADFILQPVDLEFDDILICHSNELDFYYEKKGKICRRKSKRLRSEGLRTFCREYCTEPSSELEIKRRSKKSKRVPFELCKKEIRRCRNEKENASYRKENVEKTLKKKCIQRKWPDGNMPRVEMTTRQDRKTVVKKPRKKPTWRMATVSNHTGPIHVYNNSDFVLRAEKADKFREEDRLLSFMIQLQDRDITPEDFDALLQLDDFVEPKTLPKASIDALETDTVNSSTDDVCTICMEEYGIGNVRKSLPCGHRFHSSCIRTWLSTVSFKCPVDGWEVV